MVQTKIARWVLEYDVETTLRYYTQRPIGSGCDCLDCRNFQAGGKQFYPTEFQTLADDLGIDLAKPVDLMHFGRDPSTGLHMSGGFFHVIGSIVSGADVMEWSGSSGSYRFEPMDPPFEFGFGSKADLVSDPFRSHSVMQITFMTQVLWVIAELESP